MQFTRSHLLAAALIVVVLLVGVVAGIAIDRRLLRGPSHPGPRPAAMDARGALPGAPARPGAERMRGRFLRQLGRELDLSAEQRRRVDSLFAAQQTRTRAALDSVRPRFEDLRRETEAGLRTILTPEQWTRFERMRGERLRRRTPERPRP